MKIQTLFVLFIGVLLIQACGSTSTETASAPAINLKDYEFLTEEYKGDAVAMKEAGFSIEEIFSKSFDEKYQNADAKYKVTAYNVSRNTDQPPCAVLIEFELNRKQSSLLGEGKQLDEVKYFCIPSANASTGLHQKYIQEVKKMGYMDLEVYIASVSRVLSETHLK